MMTQSPKRSYLHSYAGRGVACGTGSQGGCDTSRWQRTSSNQVHGGDDDYDKYDMMIMIIVMIKSRWLRYQ